MCGLLRRSQYPEFIDLIQQYDILCLVESKTDDCDNIELPGFISLMKNRYVFRKVRSGGIVLAYKAYLDGYINSIKTDCT